ncbi:MAG: isocitrate lyase/PEP mutase family protein [Euzebya sp.]
MDTRVRFAALHQTGIFVMPNPHDVGSARILAELGFDALATTSAGLAGTLGLPDMHITRDQLLDHVRVMSQATALPLSVDAENGFADDADGVADTVTALARAGAAGCSIEDYDPKMDAITPFPEALDRVRAAAEAASAAGLTLTARCENHLHGVRDLDDTITRLRAYAEVGAGCVYAPGLLRPADIARVVAEVPAPVNVLLLPGGPTVAELADLGVRRVSVGSVIFRLALDAYVRAATSVRDQGVYPPPVPAT